MSAINRLSVYIFTRKKEVGNEINISIVQNADTLGFSKLTNLYRNKRRKNSDTVETIIAPEAGVNEKT